MNTFRWCLRITQLFVFAAVISPGNFKIYAQGAGTIPVVTVKATQPFATATNPGVFTVFRAGSTNAALNVWYDLGGTASNGVDYAMIPPHLVSIVAGVVSNTIIITPISNSPSSVAKTVVLTLTNSPLMTPVNYEIGSPSEAVVYLRNGTATNLPPSVNIIAPKNGSVFYTPTNIQLFAKASDPDGSIANVEFFAGTTDLGKGNPVVLDPPGVNGITGPVYFLSWMSPSPGDYPLTAVATDNDGASSTSALVNVAVRTGPPTNIPPVVRIVSPANGSVFHAPIDIPLYSFANDVDGSVVSVEFFANSNSLGFGHRIPIPFAAGSVTAIYPTNLFLLIWSNAPAGNYILTADATDNSGATTVSAPVKITVLMSPPPPTNRPPIVSVVATDPIAIEGTNCWVWPGETNGSPSWATWPTAVCRFFTNCGPKTATFTVHRFGDTNDDLTVNYDLGGSASNGVDYVLLPGSVTIPAGERRALIPIVPIDDGPPDINKTVILALTPSTNTPPDYFLGYPRRAGAIILDSDGVKATAMLPGGCFHMAATGPDAAWFHIDYSTDMIQWTPVCTNQVVNGSIDFVDPDAQSNGARFYRAVPLAGPPAD